jgi:hypothetical protein
VNITVKAAWPGWPSRTSPATAARRTFPAEAFAGIDHIPGHKINWKAFSSYQVCFLATVELNHKPKNWKVSRKSSDSWKLNNSLLNNPWVKECVQRGEQVSIWSWVKMKAQRLRLCGTWQCSVWSKRWARGSNLCPELSSEETRERGKLNPV